MAAAAAAASAGDAAKQGRQIPIVCPGHTRPLADLQFCYCRAEQRTLLVSACHDRLPMLRDGQTGDWIGTFAGHKGAVWSCRLDPSANLAATASGDFSVRVWDAITGNALFTFQHHHIVKACDWSPDSRLLATGGHEGILRIYDLTQPKKDPLQVALDDSKKIMITKLSWLTDDTLLTGCGDGIIRFWKIADGIPPCEIKERQLKTAGAEVRDMELTPLSTGQQILSVAAGNRVHFFNLQKNSLLHSYEMPIHFQDEGGCSLHPSGTKFVAGGSDLWVRVFDFASGKELECLKGHHGPIRCLRYSPDGKIYATGSEDGTIRLWKTDPEQ